MRRTATPKSSGRIAATILAMACVLPLTSLAEDTAMKEEAPGLLKLAKVSPEVATATAQGQVPGGQIEAAEIEKEDGKLIYSFEMKIAGKSGVEEVNVDALTGRVVGVEHEGPKKEAKEAAADLPKPAVQP